MLNVLLFLISTLAMSQTYPDPQLTPGVVDSSVTVKQLCTPGYTSSVRLVTEKMKITVFNLYGIPLTERSGYEVDHFISLEIGGKNDIANLWPQRWKPIPGAREKDVVETWLHRQLCKGQCHLEDDCGIYPPYSSMAQACGSVKVICNGSTNDRMTLSQVQNAIRIDWYAVYQAIKRFK